MNKRYLMSCDFCGKRVVVHDSKEAANYPEIPLAPVPGGVPFINPDDKKLKTKKAVPRRKLLKCPGCGRGLMLRKDTIVLPEEEKTVEKEDIGTGREAGPPGQEIPAISPGRTPPGYPEIPQ